MSVSQVIRDGLENIVKDWAAKYMDNPLRMQSYFSYSQVCLEIGTTVYNYYTRDEIIPAIKALPKEQQFALYRLAKEWAPTYTTEQIIKLCKLIYVIHCIT